MVEKQNPSSAESLNGDQLQAAINELGQKLVDLANDKKPQGVDELTQRFPSAGTQVATGVKKRLLTKKALQELGILAPSATAVRSRGIRKIKIEELAGEFKKALRHF